MHAAFHSSALAVMVPIYFSRSKALARSPLDHCQSGRFSLGDSVGEGLLAVVY